MSGLRGALDDAYEAADDLRDALLAAAYAEADEQPTSAEVAGLCAAADDLANRIDQQRNLLRS